MTVSIMPSLSVSQYHTMINAGILKEGAPIELLEGNLVMKMTIKPPHRIATKLLRAALQKLLPEGWYDDAGPITTSDSEPEPDIVIARGNPRDYDTGHPGPKDLALVVEISDRSIVNEQEGVVMLAQVSPDAPHLDQVATTLSPRLWRMTVDQYHELARIGFLKSKDRLELIEGLLVTKVTIHPPHTFASQSLRTLLERLLPSGWFTNSEQPITTQDSEPEPDISIVRGKRRTFVQEERHAAPSDLLLVAEVADSSLAEDQTTKQRLYARAAIAVYWIVNLVDRRVEVYTEPTGPCVAPAYRMVESFGPDDLIPVLIEGREVGRIAVADILP